MKNFLRFGFGVVLPITVCFLLTALPANAQLSITGTSSISYDPGSGTVQSFSETQSSDPFYLAGVDATLSGPSGYTGGSDSSFGQVSLSLDVGEAYGTYEVDSSHYVITGDYDIYDVADQASWNPLGGFFGDSYGYGYDGHDGQCYYCSGGEEFQLGDTWASVEVEVPCPTTMSVAALTPGSLASNNNFPTYLTGVGALATMTVGPAGKNYTGAVLVETVTPQTDSCPSNIRQYTDFPTIVASQNSSFTVGATALWEGNTYPTVLNSFYDSHKLESNQNLLGYTSVTSCVATATQVYACRGTAVASFTLTNTYTSGTISNQAVTFVGVTKQ